MTFLVRRKCKYSLEGQSPGVSPERNGVSIYRNQVKKISCCRFDWKTASDSNDLGMEVYVGKG